MKSVLVGEKFYQVPSSWKEVRPRLFLAMVPHLARLHPSDGLGFSEKEMRAQRARARVKLLRLLLPAPLMDWARLLKDQRLHQLVHLVDFCDEFPLEMPLKGFRSGPFRYLVPAYARLSTIEVTSAQQSLMRSDALSDSNPDEAGRLRDEAVSKLCRPRRPWLTLAPWLRYWAADWDGDERIRYSDAVVPRHLTYVARANPVAKLAILLWFFAAIARMRKQFPDLFKESSGSSRPMAYLVLDLAHGDLTKIKDLAHIPMLTTLAQLQTDHDSAEAQRAKLPGQK